MTGTRLPLASVVVPAHDEEAVIGRCLDALLADTQPGELEVVVVCNGCSDATAAVAERRGPAVCVAELPEPSKPDALNLGDTLASAFPRLYLDADVVLSAECVRLLSEAVSDGGVLAAAPELRLDQSDSSWPVRSYNRVWARLPAVEHSVAGRGAYLLSEEGRGRFGNFPPIVADDQFVNELFAPAEKLNVAGCFSTVRTPFTFGDLVSRKTRVFRGNRELRMGGARPVSDRRAWLGVVSSDPARVVDIPAYLAVTFWSKLRARRTGERWERDESRRNP
ncbi:MAG: hypothetical protein JJLCMIEE_02318 [Acidimicrobiales bacterium]|nr:MAG: glycosyltransferase [Actinomycetota bacterium]MBV6509249.1 hypothetical protein [Acidimicrobiales bacterium]RIK04022.1 MAG: glycosyl transferase [Acidobacteriota bacterium]